MKLKWLVGLGAAGVLAVMVVWLMPAPGGNAVAATPFTALSGVAVPEIPAKAADLVQAAAVSDREQSAAAVLRAVVTVARPGVLPYVVSAICRRNPEVAGAVVTTAIELQPRDVLIFSQAALCAAPGQVEQIVAAACQAAPSSFANVALVASRQMPSANHLILAGLAGGLPGLKPCLAQAESLSATNDVEAVIKQTVQLLTDAAKVESRK